MSSVEPVDICSDHSHKCVSTFTIISLMITSSTIASKRKSSLRWKNITGPLTLVISSHRRLRFNSSHSLFVYAGKALCGNKSCRADLGCITRLKDNPNMPPIYPLKCRSIKIRQLDQTTGAEKIILKSKWKDMPFSIPPFEHSSVHHDVFYDALDTLTNDPCRE